MALDPQTKNLLDTMAAAGRPALNEQTPAEARAGFVPLAQMAGAPEPVASVEDRRIPGPGGDIPVRIFTPEGSAPFPTLVFFHGGGWVLGDLNTHDVVCRAIAKHSGCKVVAVDYRLAPEHKYPAAADDAFAATRWVAENAAALEVDAGRIAVGGDSAGGNLTLAVAQMARDTGSPALRFQLAWYPVTDFNFGTDSYKDNADGYLLTRASMEWFWDHYLAAPEDGAQPYASPLRAADLTGLPPAHIITAEFDPLRDEGEAYAARLRAAGVPVMAKRYDGLVHGSFQLGGVLDAGRQMLLDGAAALKAGLA